MKIAVVSCHAYRDAWQAFFKLFFKFWLDCEHKVYLVTDHDHVEIEGVLSFIHRSSSWSEIVASFARTHPDEPILLLQEDFFLKEPVRKNLVDEALNCFGDSQIGAVRLYPCPGSDMEDGTENFGFVSRDAQYRTSCQATIWRPEYLAEIAEHSRGFAADFEIGGGRYAAKSLPLEVMAFRRERLPRPIEYLCTAIVRGRWLPEAKVLCDENGIVMDWSRGFVVRGD